MENFKFFSGRKIERYGLDELIESYTQLDDSIEIDDPIETSDDEPFELRGLDNELLFWFNKNTGTAILYRLTSE